MKNASTILAVIGIIGVLAVAGYFYTQMQTYAPADITGEQDTAPAVNPASVPPVEPVAAEPIAPTPVPTINPVSTPVEPIAAAPVPEDENTAEEATENAPSDVTDAPAPNPADIDMPTDADMPLPQDQSLDATSQPTTVAEVDADPAEWTACTTDTDCAPVGTECCAANYTNAVNNKFADAWTAKHPKQDCDPGMACIMMMPIAHCVAGNCTMNANPSDD